MKAFLFLIAFASFHTALLAQSNLYSVDSSSSLTNWPVIESGNRLYYLSYSQDTGSNGVSRNNYFFICANKTSGNVLAKKLIVHDTAFSIYEGTQPLAVSYCMSADKTKINFFVVTDKDSSLNNPHISLQYPKAINYLQLDTALNVIGGPKVLTSFSRPSLYSFYSIGFSTQTQNNRTTLCYVVRDSFISGGFRGMADKLLTVDDTGKLLSDRFLGYEPKPIGQGFNNHLSFGQLYRMPGERFASLAHFQDSVFANRYYNLFILDSNMEVVDTIYHPLIYEFNGSIPGILKTELDANAVHLAFLPTGSLIRSSLAFYTSAADNIKYGYYALSKGTKASRYLAMQVYFPPKAEPDDYAHSSNSGQTGCIYNPHDNRVYAFTSTHSDPTTFKYCLGDVSNSGQIACVDTNLVEQWVKYIRPQPGYCIQSFSVHTPHGRPGVVVSGFAFKIGDPNNSTSRKPFIYHVDSNTSLSVNAPLNPVTFSGQFSIYPNPANDYVTIDNATAEKFQYVIVNAIGQSVIVGNSDSGLSKISLSNYPSGVYLIKITTAKNRLHAFKFVKA